MTFAFSIGGVPWTVIIPSGFPRIAAATTLGATSRFEGNICPDVVSLGHEHYHAIHTSWIRYVISFTVGLLWGSSYWRDEETAANAAGAVASTNPELVGAAATLRATLPATWPTVTINHPV